MASSLAGLLLACAGEGEPSEAPEERDAPIDAQGSDGSEAGEADSSDGGVVEASPCSDDGLCAISIPVKSDVTLMSVWGSNATDVWAVGARGTILHYDGVTWEVADRVLPDASTEYTMRDVWLERPDEVWIIDGPRVRRGTGWRGPSATKWSYFEPSNPQNPPAFIRRVDGTFWLGRGLLSSTIGFPLLARFDVWDGGPVAPQAVTELFLSTRTAAVTGSRELWIIAGALFPPTGDSVVYQVSREASAGEDAAAAAWRVQQHGTGGGRFTSVWGDETAIWLVGEEGALRRMKRESISTRVYEIIKNSYTEDLDGVFGFAPDDIWAVGKASTVLHYDGTTWTKLSTPFDGLERKKPHLRAVWGNSSKDVWIAGEGTMLHFAGRP